MKRFHLEYLKHNDFSCMGKTVNGKFPILGHLLVIRYEYYKQIWKKEIWLSIIVFILPLMMFCFSTLAVICMRFELNYFHLNIFVIDTLPSVVELIKQCHICGFWSLSKFFLIIFKFTWWQLVLWTVISSKIKLSVYFE